MITEERLRQLAGMPMKLQDLYEEKQIPLKSRDGEAQAYLVNWNSRTSTGSGYRNRGYSSAQPTKTNILVKLKKVIEQFEIEINDRHNHPKIEDSKSAKLEKVIECCRKVGWGSSKVDELERRLEAIDAKIFGNKDKVITNITAASKDPANDDAVKREIARSRKHGHDYPEFKHIEKKGGVEYERMKLKEILKIDNLDEREVEAAALKYLHAGDKSEQIVEYLKKSKLNYYPTLIKDLFDTKYIVSIAKHNVLNSYTDGIEGFNVMFDSVAAGYHYPEFDKLLKDALSKTVTDYADSRQLEKFAALVKSAKKVGMKPEFSKDQVVKFILICYKGDDYNKKSLAKAITMLKEAGLNWPELDAVEKSMKSAHEESDESADDV